MIRGESVTVVRKSLVSYDAFNNPVYSDITETVDDVLVIPGACSDIDDSNRPDGADVKFTLHFPKSYQEDLEGCSVTVRGESLDVIGHPARYTESNTPGMWNMPAEVGGSHG